MSIGLRTLLSVRRYQTARDLQYRRYGFACFDVAPVRFAGAMGTSEMRANNRKIYMIAGLRLRPPVAAPASLGLVQLAIIASLFSGFHNRFPTGGGIEDCGTGIFAPPSNISGRDRLMLRDFLPAGESRSNRKMSDPNFVCSRCRGTNDP